MRLDSGDYAQDVRLGAELLDMPAIRALQQRSEPDDRPIGIRDRLSSRYQRARTGKRGAAPIS
jgi:hypothetical protein